MNQISSEPLRGILDLEALSREISARVLQDLRRDGLAIGAGTAPRPEAPVAAPTVLQGLAALHRLQAAPTPRDHVIWAYRLFLRREPESEKVIELYADVFRKGGIKALTAHFLASPEFIGKNPAAMQAGVPSGPRYVMTENPDGARFWVNLKDRFVSHPILRGNYEPTETRYVRQTVRKGMRIVDIGANLGWFTVHMARLAGESGHVSSFEPRPDLFAYLYKTVGENGLRNVTLRQLALGDAPGEAELHWLSSDENPGGTQLHVAAARKGEAYSYVKVPMVRLDDEVEGAVDFIKIDVEGAEKLVFSGATRILTQSRPVIMSELSPDSLGQVSRTTVADYLAFLHALDYRVVQLNEDASHGEELTAWPYSDPTRLITVVLLPRG